MLNTLDAIRNESVLHIVVVGAYADYGSRDKMLTIESPPTNPITPYGASKLFMEGMLADYVKAHDIKWISIRHFNAADCDLKAKKSELLDPESHLHPRAQMAVAERIPRLENFSDKYSTPDGNSVRNDVHATDWADGHWDGDLATGDRNDPINLGTGQGLSIRESMRAIEDVTSRPVPHNMTDCRKGDQSSLIATDVSKGKELLCRNSERCSMVHVIETSRAGKA
jgi:UDP-glucose 4-epimerase